MLTLWWDEGGVEDIMAATGAPNRTRKTKDQGVDGDLPAEITQARRFGKTRSAQSTALLEDYVELIADLWASAGEARQPILRGGSVCRMPPLSRRYRD